MADDLEVHREVLDGSDDRSVDAEGGDPAPVVVVPSFTATLRCDGLGLDPTCGGISIPGAMASLLKEGSRLEVTNVLDEDFSDDWDLEGVADFGDYDCGTQTVTLEVTRVELSARVKWLGGEISHELHAEFFAKVVE